MTKSEYQRQWALDHKDELKEYRHQWYLAHKAEQNRKSAEYNKAHPEQRKETLQRYHTKLKGCGRRENNLYTDDWEHVEGYDRLIASGGSLSNMKGFHVHHRFEDMGLSMTDLKEMNLYYHRPACELIIMTMSEHRRHHHNFNKGI